MEIPRSDSKQPITLTFFTTGTVKIKHAMKGQPITNRNITMRRFRSLIDRQWSDSLPIGVFLISHPNGPILFDTGESPHVNDPGFKPFWSPIGLFSTTEIRPEDGIMQQLKANGVEPKDLQAIVLSHLHGDHAGRLLDLVTEAPDVPIYVSQDHWEAFGNSPVFATMQGCNPSRWPNPFEPRTLDFSDGPVGPWKQSAKISPDGRIIAVLSPGHVPGHMSLIVFGVSPDGIDTTYLLPGDATYGIDVLDKEEPDGINDDPIGALESLKLLKEFAKETEVVVLPSHDPDTPRLLKDRIIYKPKPI
uniref:Metallo-beta-lactamase domain-containing protein n=1 Tax=Bionectria ochroleuca TaxID=29856 RepID=A0A8H7K579_BIOOC